MLCQNVVKRYWLALIRQAETESTIRIYAETEAAARLIAQKYGDVLSLSEIDFRGCDLMWRQKMT